MTRPRPDHLDRNSSRRHTDRNNHRRNHDETQGNVDRRRSDGRSRDRDRCSPSTQSAQALAQATPPLTAGGVLDRIIKDKKIRDHGGSHVAAVRHPRQATTSPTARRSRPSRQLAQGPRRRAGARAGHRAAAHSGAARRTRRRRDLVAVDHVRSREDGDVRAAARRAVDRDRRAEEDADQERGRHGRQEDRHHARDARGGDGAGASRRPAPTSSSSTTSPRRCRRWSRARSTPPACRRSRRSRWPTAIRSAEIENKFTVTHRVLRGGRAARRLRPAAVPAHVGVPEQAERRAGERSTRSTPRSRWSICRRCESRRCPECRVGQPECSERRRSRAPGVRGVREGELTIDKAIALRSLAMKYVFQFGIVWDHLPRLLDGAWLTLRLSVGAFALGFALAAAARVRCARRGRGRCARRSRRTWSSSATRRSWCSCSSSTFRCRRSASASRRSPRRCSG